MFDGKCVLITGGTGSFGRKCVEMLLTEHPNIDRIVIYSRDELKQFLMSKEKPFCDYALKLRFFIGDVRDLTRLTMACEGVDYVIHAAALKQLPTCEYNPMEAIKTNILGAQNVISASLATQVRSVVALSTDKAAAPVNLYGATKLCSDKLFVTANNIKGSRPINYSVVRYGNVLGSRGSVIPFFLEQKKNGVLPITDEGMTRFSITLEEGVRLVFFAIENMQGGEIYVPKIPSYRIMDVAKAVAPDCRTEIIGIRAGEKLHEQMITEDDSLQTYDCGDKFIIVPAKPRINFKEYTCEREHSLVPRGFQYNSGNNDVWLSVEELRTQIKAHVDPNFTI